MKSFNLFPISDYYKANLIDAITITRGGGWWSAILLIKDPKSNDPMISFYRWNKIGEDWKIKKSYNIHSKKELDDIVKVLNDFRNQLNR